MCVNICLFCAGHQHEFTLDMARNLIDAFTVSFILQAL